MHLTAQFVKATKRLLQLSFKAHLGSEENTGKNQFAYKYGRGARDALAFLVLTWIESFYRKVHFVIYCSNISGA